MTQDTVKDFYERNFRLSPSNQEYCFRPARSERYFSVFNILESLQVKPRAVELGFGGRQNLRWLSELCETLTIVDIVDRAGELEFPNLRFVEGDLNKNFPFRSSEFDLVIALMVIEHLFDPFHSFSQVSRILKPGGKTIINLPLVTGIKNRVRLLFGIPPITSRKDWYSTREWDGGHLHYFSIALVKRLGADHGLELLSCYPCGNLTLLKRIFPSLLCGEMSFIFQRKY